MHTYIYEILTNLHTYVRVCMANTRTGRMNHPNVCKSARTYFCTNTRESTAHKNDKNRNKRKNWLIFLEYNFFFIKLIVCKPKSYKYWL